MDIIIIIIILVVVCVICSPCGVMFYRMVWDENVSCGCLSVHAGCGHGVRSVQTIQFGTVRRFKCKAKIVLVLIRC